MSRKVIDVVNTTRNNNAILFLNFEAETGDSLSLEQVENLVMMSLESFIEKLDSFTNISFVINNENQKQYFWGNSTLSIETDGDTKMLIAQMVTNIGGTTMQFDIDVSINSNGLESASYTQTISE